MADRPVGRLAPERARLRGPMPVRCEICQWRGRRHILPALEVSSLTLQRGVPIPETMRGDKSKGRTRYDKVFDRLDADGTSVRGIPISYRAAISKAVQIYVRQRPSLAGASRLVVRTLSDSECGVWRVAKAA